MKDINELDKWFLHLIGFSSYGVGLTLWQDNLHTSLSHEVLRSQNTFTPNVECQFSLLPGVH
jgi:hypothetical protein